MEQSAQYVNELGQRIIEPKPRMGDDLDVGFGGPIGGLMEKLAQAKRVMDLAEEVYPYEKTGVKKTGKLTSAKDEVEVVNSRPLKTLREEVDEYDTPAPQQRKPVQKQVTPPKNKKMLYEDDNYIYYSKDGVQEDDEYDVRTAPSLTNELLMATKGKNNSSNLPDMSASINEQMVRNSNLPDFIKQSFLKNPLTPPKLTAAMGSGQLDAITEEFRKQKLLKNNSNVVAVPKKKLTEQQVEPIASSKREKIKAQLKPIVRELIREILLEKI